MDKVKYNLISSIFLLFIIFPAFIFAEENSGEQVTFTDITKQANITFKHSFGDYDLTNIVEGTGAGPLFFDYDNDGWIDIYFVNGSWNRAINDSRGRRLRDQLFNALYRNNGDGTFTDVTDEAGVGDPSPGYSSSAADYDGDEDLDLYVQNYGPNVMYRNNGNGTFTDVSRESGLDDASWSLSSPWFDYDKDGDLDVFVANYLEYDDGTFRSYYAAKGYPGPLSYSAQMDALYRNNGDGTFTEVSKEAGIIKTNGRAMSSTVADLNNDGWLDIYVANDGTENFYYENRKDGTFEEKGMFLGLAFGEHGQGVSSMGPFIGDINRDNLLDVYIPDMGYSSLLMNQGEFFEDHTTRSTLAITCGQYTGWGGLLLDYDNNGSLDLFVANGNAHHEYTEEDVLMKNRGNGIFQDVSKDSGEYFLTEHVGRGSSFADIDNDGDLDLLILNLNDYATLLRNDGGNKNNWLKILPVMKAGGLPVYGARIIVTSGGLDMIEDLIPVRGYLSQIDARMHFGLGKNTEADVSVRWPDGSVQEMRNVKANQIITVVKENR